jgi:PAS domain S-box-containing protein
MNFYKPHKIQIVLTIQFGIFFILLAAFIYFFFTGHFEEDVQNKFLFKSDVVVRYVEQNPQIFYGNKIVHKEGLTQLLHLNDIIYLVLLDEAGNLVDAINLEEAEYFFYLLSDHSKYLSADGTVYRLSLPVTFRSSTNYNSGKIYIGYKAGLTYYDLKRNLMLTMLYSLSILFVGIVITYLLSSISFRPILRLYSALSKTDPEERKALLSKFKDDEIGTLASRINEMLDKLDHSSFEVENLNERVKELFKEKIYELDAEISQRKKAESFMKKTEEVFKLMFENAPIGMLIVSKEGRVLKANKAFCYTVGYDESEITGTGIKNFFAANSTNETKPTYIMIMENESLDIECRLTKRDGRKISALMKTIRVIDDRGEMNNTLVQVLDITQIKKTQAELLLALDQAKESDRLKSAFLAQMSHEIRTPLNVILPSIPILADEVGSKDKEIISILNAVDNAGKRLQRTIDMILSMSAVQSGNYKANFETFNIAEDLKNLAQEFRGVVKEKGLKLYFSNSCSNPEVSADRYTIGQVFQNLIGNAVKYTQAGHVRISIEDYEASKIIVKIEDTGIGISEKYLKNLFAPFSQEDAGQTRKYEGNGLGLALVKEYVNLNKGIISVTSEKDKGSVFSVVLEKKIIKAPYQDKTVLVNES